MHQHSLFELPPEPPCQVHSTTSREAAKAIEPRAATLRRLVLDYLRGQGEQGATDLEMQEALGMDGNTQRPRRVELLTAGLIRDSGCTRATRHGRQAVVWIANR